MSEDQSEFEADRANFMARMYRNEARINAGALAGQCVDHIDGDPTNNDPVNLRLVDKP